MTDGDSDARTGACRSCACSSVQTARALADALLQTWTEVERDPALAQSLRSNVNALRSHGDDALWSTAAYPVLFRSERSLGDAGLFTAAID